MVCQQSFWSAYIFSLRWFYREVRFYWNGVYFLWCSHFLLDVPVRLCKVKCLCLSKSLKTWEELHFLVSRISYRLVNWWDSQLFQFCWLPVLKSRICNVYLVIFFFFSPNSSKICVANGNLPLIFVFFPYIFSLAALLVLRISWLFSNLALEILLIQVYSTSGWPLWSLLLWFCLFKCFWFNVYEELEKASRAPLTHWTSSRSIQKQFPASSCSWFPF